MKKKRTQTADLKIILDQFTEFREEMIIEIGGLKKKMDDLKKKMDDLEKKMVTKEDFQKELDNIKSHLRIQQLREDTGLSMLLSPGQQASIGVSGFEID